MKNYDNRRSREGAAREQQMEELKTEWLSILNGLVENINQRFSRFFALLDFAGEVRLAHGTHDNDFENYGLKIFVTFREREPLQVMSLSHFGKRAALGMICVTLRWRSYCMSH
jgi:chromosome segregation ATPase